MFSSIQQSEHSCILAMIVKVLNSEDMAEGAPSLCRRFL